MTFHDLPRYMPPGGLCVEVEAPDPSHLYYDHHATFQELADIYGHTFVRSTSEVDDAPGLVPQALVGDVPIARDLP